MSRRLALGASLLLVLLAAAAPAGAHPLGNFSINHLTQVRVSPRVIDLHYILDQAEIPTFQERGLSHAAILARKQAEVASALVLTVDGRRVPLRFLPGASLGFPPGQGGLPLTRVEFSLAATVSDPRTVSLQDGTFPDRIGWKAIVAQPGSGTSVHTDAPSGDPTNGLHTYPQSMLSSPLAQRSASFTVRPGSGTLVAPKEAGASEATTQNRSGDGFAAVFASAAAGKGVLIFLLLAAFGWGALHALSPGHGKAMVAAYLVGTRGTTRHAAALGLTVTITHTLGVFALGAITLLLSQYILPEQLYPWLTLASGLLVVLIGGSVLRSRLRWFRSNRRETPHAHSHDQGAVSAGQSHGLEVARAVSAAHSHRGGPEAAHTDDDRIVATHSHAPEMVHPAHRHEQGLAAVRFATDGPYHRHGHLDDAHGSGRDRDLPDHDHDHAGENAHSGENGHSHENGHSDENGLWHDHSHGHGHGHHHHLPDRITWRGLLAMGASAGLIPCPSALVVLLGAIAQHQVGLGLLLIVAFSAGLAATLTALGIAVVHAGRLTARINFSSRTAAALPAVSAVVIVAAGCVLTAQALPKVLG